MEQPRPHRSRHAQWPHLHRQTKDQSQYCVRRVGIREVEEKIWLVSFLDFDLGYFDEAEGRAEPGPNPFQAKLLTMSSV